VITTTQSCYLNTTTKKYRKKCNNNHKKKSIYTFVFDDESCYKNYGSSWFQEKEKVNGGTLLNDTCKLIILIYKSIFSITLRFTKQNKS